MLANLTPPRDGWLIGIGRKAKGRGRDLMVFIDEKEGLNKTKLRKRIIKIYELIKEWERG